jgi:hypothetical protein
MDKSQRSDIERRDCCSRVYEVLAGLVREANGVPKRRSNKVQHQYTHVVAHAQDRSWHAALQQLCPQFGGHLPCWLGDDGPVPRPPRGGVHRAADTRANWTHVTLSKRRSPATQREHGSFGCAGAVKNLDRILALRRHSYFAAHVCGVARQGTGDKGPASVWYGLT